MHLKPPVGYRGVYFNVLKRDSINALSSDTLGLLLDAVIPSSYSFVRSALARIGLPLSECRTRGLPVDFRIVVVNYAAIVFMLGSV